MYLVFFKYLSIAFLLQPRDLAFEPGTTFCKVSQWKITVQSQIRGVWCLDTLAKCI